jgi:hypothetical protein
MVAPAVARGIKEYLIDDATTTVERIHVCGCFEDDVPALGAAFDREFAVLQPLAVETPIADDLG